ncbi:MAG: glycosyl hydrolase 115 family protein [Spirochaetales bacterium]|nr:glycosyl hydrolase 115 family protein [Spirochaetales bacterium]
MIINSSTTLNIQTETGLPLKRALEGFERDFHSLFGASLSRTSEIEQNQIRITLSKGEELPAECFHIRSSEESLEISAGDEMGLVFGLYRVSENLLEVDPFTLWTGLQPAPRTSIDTGDLDYRSPELTPRIRGWFINDEDCLIAWDDSIDITEEIWCRVYETILRSGYNCVIPGTGITPKGIHMDLAAEFGLYISQHHAEPLGAEMFSDVYPDIPVRLPEEKGRFEELYREAVKSAAGRKMVWTVGFRGQGDHPFSEDDPRYDTPEKQGALIAEMVALQQIIVREIAGEDQLFIHYLYSETGALYKEGHLKLPEDVIRVYSDNGFGAMRVRREGRAPELGISALPIEADREHRVGIYYHVSFHDLHISNKLVPLVSREVMDENLTPFDQHRHFDFFLLNVSNIRPQVLQIQQLRALWSGQSGTPAPGSPDSDGPGSEHPALGSRLAERTLEWLERYFPGREEEILNLLDAYFAAPLSFNDLYSDAKAGEQLYHHGLRRLVRTIIRKEDVRPWFAYIPEEFADNVSCTEWILKRAADSLPGWEELAMKASAFEETLEGFQKEFFRGFLGMHISYMKESCEGFVRGCEAFLSFEKGEYIDVFTGFYLSREAMKRALAALEAEDKGIWENFHRGDWLTGTAETVRYLKTAMSYTKMIGEDLIWNSDWGIRALKLTETAIATMPQATIPDSVLAKGLLGIGPDAGPLLLRHNRE